MRKVGWIEIGIGIRRERLGWTLGIEVKFRFEKLGEAVACCQVDCWCCERITTRAD